MAKKTEDNSSQATEERPGKSAFIREQFRKNPNVTMKETATAWAEAGNTSKLHDALFYQIKKSLGLGPKTSGKRDQKVNRSGFIRDYLGEHPQASLKEVVEAWKGSGQKDDLNPTLYYQMKNQLKLGGGKRTSTSGSSSSAAPSWSKSSKSSGGDYLELEQALDGLIDMARRLDNDRLVDQLRHARRIASAQILN